MPMRSLLFAPANHARRAEKALSLPADAVILDLEDAVAVSEKEAARADAVAACALPRRGRLFIRVNALSTPWALADLLAVVRPGLDGIVLPKVEGAEEMATAEWLLAALERDAGLPAGRLELLPIIETARGMQALDAIARAARRARRVAFGAADFNMDMGLSWTREEAELAPWRAQCVLASRAAGLEAPVDTVWTALKDAEGFAASLERARVLGFGGKLCIHPDQVEPANRAFSPSDAQLEHARRVVAAFAEAEARGLASISLDGAFVDYPVAEAARRVLAQAGPTG
ncbi:HpcH/HpaI aldolase/citrate lyase family protein [Roseococcus sp. DSY-14]|uniref:HpcH/HpaI aldolase/citrate lyase family protein n=1 Tax=Roseococcus sp. DSY-14 TaxID=3369650 RepID=UPI00387AC55A